MEKICGIYKITNTVTGDFYIGSSKDVKRRWREHKWPSKWNECPNNQLYKDMQKYGLDKFEFQVIVEIEADSLKVIEQQFIETLKPTYNNYNANGWDFERYKESQKEYNKSDKCKKARKEYYKAHKDEFKKYQKEYYQKYKKTKKEYNNQLCCYNGEVLTLNALAIRFRRQGIPHPMQEAKKYLLE